MIKQWVLPISWEWSTLEDIASPEKNSVVDGPFGSNMKTSDYVDDGIPVLQGKNITNNIFKWFGVRYVSEEKAEELKRSSVKLGDILIIKIGSIGYAAELTDLQGYSFAIIPANLAKLTVDETLVDKQYILHWLSSVEANRHLNSVASKTAQPALSLGKIKALPIPLPPLKEQKRIAAILDKADNLRRKRQQAIQLADEFLRAVFLDMFGDPVSNPKGWEVGSAEQGVRRVQLGDVIRVDAPMVDPKRDDYLDLLHIGPNRIEKETGRLLPALTAREEGLISSKFLFDEKYVLYSKIRPYLKKCALAVGSGLCSADMYPIRPVEGKMTREFLWMLLLSAAFDAYVASLPGRANIPKLNRTELGAFEFWVPEFELQIKYSHIVKRINGFKDKLGKTDISPENLFGSISQKAFAGKL